MTDTETTETTAETTVAETVDQPVYRLVGPGPFRTPGGQVNLRKSCACGKDGTPEAHGGIGSRRALLCSEVRAQRAQIEHAYNRPHRRLARWLFGGAA